MSRFSSVVASYDATLVPTTAHITRTVRIEAMMIKVFP
jgi:hypothetical protein